MAHGDHNGDIMPLEIMARREDWNRGVALYMRRRIVGVSVAFAKPIEFETETDENMGAGPAAVIPIQSAQQLMDELWQCGLRPTEGSGSAGSLAATERHLKDMQKIAFQLLREETFMADEQRKNGGVMAVGL